VGDSVFDVKKEILTYIQDTTDLLHYKPENGTFPVLITETTKRKLEEKKINYLKKRKLDHVDKIVTIGYKKARDNPNNSRTEFFKGKLIDQMKVKVEFNQLENIKYSKFNLKLIFKLTIDKNFKKRWTSKQVDWMHNGIDLQGLLQNPLKAISRIDDFRRKFLMSYWGKLCENCELCGQKWHREHLFLHCPNVKKWQFELFKNRASAIRTEHEKAMFNHLSPNHTSSWVHNWAIWKNYWEIVFQKFDNSNKEEDQIENFRKLLKFNEFLHLKFSLSTLSENRLQKLSEQTKLFFFYSLNDSMLIQPNKAPNSSQLVSLQPPNQAVFMLFTLAKKKKKNNRNSRKK